MNKHKFPYIYDQCEDKTGYDEMIERLTHFELLKAIDMNCELCTPTYWPRSDISEFGEFIDFIDGNGFFVAGLYGSCIIAPMNSEFVLI